MKESEQRFLAQGFTVALTITTLYATQSGVQEAQEAVTLVSVLLMATSFCLWLLSDHTIYGYRHSIFQERFMVANLFIQLTLMAVFGWWLTFAFRLIAWMNELYREKVSTRGIIRVQY